MQPYLFMQLIKPLYVAAYMAEPRERWSAPFVLKLIIYLKDQDVHSKADTDHIFLMEGKMTGWNTAWLRPPEVPNF